MYDYTVNMITDAYHSYDYNDIEISADSIDDVEDAVYEWFLETYDDGETEWENATEYPYEIKITWSNDPEWIKEHPEEEED